MAFNIIFDTDMGNDIDDALALAMAASAHVKGEANLALIASSNPNPASVAMIKAACRYYGIDGCMLAIHKGKLKYANDAAGFCRKTAEFCGIDVDAAGAEALDAVPALRKALASMPDKSVRFVATGFSTNLAGLLDSPANFNNDGIQLDGIELVRRKAQFLSIMAGDFHNSQKDANGKPGPEFNVLGDIPAMKKVMDAWPAPVYVSDFSIGLAVCVSWQLLDKQMKDKNPVKFAYKAYYNGTPGERFSWDQTSMLFALEPDARHFKLSPEGEIAIDENGFSRFTEKPGGMRFLLLFDEQRTPEAVNRAMHKLYVEP